MVSLLAESYNPHVRYGAAMALGIACAGTGLREAIALLEPMVKFDPVNFVRQGALVSCCSTKSQYKTKDSIKEFPIRTSMEIIEFTKIIFLFRLRRQ